MLVKSYSLASWGPRATVKKNFKDHMHNSRQGFGRAWSVVTSKAAPSRSCDMKEYEGRREDIKVT